ncbi:MAG: polysaccharide deacetylase family protein [Candidatus Hodarchaeota archaeon]
MSENKSKICLLSFDVEEWFQVENLKGAIRESEWEIKKSTVVQNTHRILDLLDQYNLKGTFFILGWVAERNPQLVKDIQKKGHEIASHGFGHGLANKLDSEQILYDIQKSKEILESINSQKILGYRAPNFSINDRILNKLKELNFLYDSSYNPFKLNRRYGSLNDLGCPISSGCYLTSSGLYEIPVSSIRILNVSLPMAGGAYFRIAPLWIFKKLVKKKLEMDSLYNFYLHPWEFEPEQERINKINLNHRFRHYYGLKSTRKKFKEFINYLINFECEFMTMTQYIQYLINQDYTVLDTID